jgi:hypothetical protein
MKLVFVDESYHRQLIWIKLTNYLPTYLPIGLNFDDGWNCVHGFGHIYEIYMDENDLHMTTHWMK